MTFCRQRHDEILYGHFVLRDGSNSPTTLHGEDPGRTPLLGMDGYHDQNRDGSSSESSVGTGNGGRLSFDEFTGSEQDGGHPQVDEDTTGGEFVDVTEQVGENEQSGIELPYEGFLIEEKRNTREEEYKNIKTTSEKRPSTERRAHPKLFESDDDDDEDEMFAL